MNRARLLAVLFALLLSACAPALKPALPEPAPDHVLTPEKPFGPRMSLEDFLKQAFDRQYPAPVRFPPPENTGEYFVELAHEPPLLHLATGVRSYAAGAIGLAAGLDNGDILIWSDWPCPALTLPEPGAVELIAWDGASPFLGAVDALRRNLHVYDLQHCAHVGTVASEGPILVAAVSASGAWAALVDEGRRLRVGPVDGPLGHAGILRFQPLALTFSPREGLLFSIDQAGWLLHWILPDQRALEQVLIPQGPFERARFKGQYLFLEKALRGTAHAAQAGADDPMVWDIPAARVASAGQVPDGFELEGGLLTYQARESRWIRKMHLGRPLPRVWASSSARLLQVKDLDGALRCYSALDGLPEDPQQCAIKDWEELGVNAGGRFQWGGAAYALADPVLVRDGLVLYSRRLPTDRFFLWWEAAGPGLAKWPDQSQEPQHAGKLPARESLRLEIPPVWVPVLHQRPDFMGDAE